MAASGARALLLWSRQQTEGYSDVNIYNMTSSWRDGLAFCAIIHRYRPDLIEIERLTKEDVIRNNELAFDICERHLDIPSILDVYDMVDKQVPDKLSVITFVSQLFNYFKDKIPANQVVCTKMNPLLKAKNDTALVGKSGKRASQQIYALQGKAKKISSALKNVFRSDNKEDRLKIEDTLSKHPSTENLRSTLDNSNRIENAYPPITSPSQSNLGTTCSICNKKVYIMERLVVEHKLFHRGCFRCSKCDFGLRPGTYSYCSSTGLFCCLYKCIEGFKNEPEDINIKLQPITDHVFDVLEENERTLSSRKLSFDSRIQQNNLGPPFSIIKKNPISIEALPKSFEDISNLKSKQRKGRRKSSGHKPNKERLAVDWGSDLKKSYSDNSLSTNASTKIEVEVKRENGKVKSSVRINPMQPKMSSVQSREKDGDQSGKVETNNDVRPSLKETAKERGGLNDANKKDEDEKPQEGSVQQLRKKFMNIEGIIDNKHKQKVAKKNERMQRELRRVVRTWSSSSPNISKDDQSKDTKMSIINGNEANKSDSISKDMNDSQRLSSEESCAKETNSTREATHDFIEEKPNEISENNEIENKPLSSSSDSQPLKNLASLTNSNIKTQGALTVPVEESSSSSPCSTPSPARQTIPIIIKQPSIDCDIVKKDERERSVSQSSGNTNLHIISPLSDTDSPASPVFTYENRWPSQTSLEGTSSTCSSPRISIVIAQEASYTKVNSRYFTVETCEAKHVEKHIIMEENEVETMVEGEFCFGIESGRFSKAQRNVLKSLSNHRITRVKSDRVRGEEMVFSHAEICEELHALGTLHSELEKRGVDAEKFLRNSMTSVRPLENEDDILREWLTLVQEKNVILKRESELIYLIKFHQYEDRYLAMECELRALLSMKDDVKSLASVQKERELMSELFNLVQKRSSIVDKLGEDRIREKQQDENVKQVIGSGVNEPTEESWEQKQEYHTKVAFSRFYC